MSNGPLKDVCWKGNRSQKISSMSVAGIEQTTTIATILEASDANGDSGRASSSTRRMVPSGGLISKERSMRTLMPVQIVQKSIAVG